MSEWRLAKSLLTLFKQLNEAAPGRSKASDGTIGDAAHQATASDHNPRLIKGAGSVPVVTAGDFTHDPKHGADMDAISDALAASKDRRISYVIFNRLIMSGAAGPAPWVWRAYTGSNPHDKHMHVSVVGTALCDDTSQWMIGESDVTPAQEAKLDKILAAMAALQKDVDGLEKAVAVLKTAADKEAKSNWADTNRLLTLLSHEPAAKYKITGEATARSEANVLAERVDSIERSLTELGKTLPASISDEQLERVLRRVLGMVPAS